MDIRQHLTRLERLVARISEGEAEELWMSCRERFTDREMAEIIGEELWPDDPAFLDTLERFCAGDPEADAIVSDRYAQDYGGGTEVVNTVTKRKKRTERGPDGRFLPGNSGGPGNPYGRRVAELRNALMEAVTPDRLRRMIESLVQAAEGGDTAAAKLVLSYTLGPPVAADILERLEALKQVLEAQA